MNTVVAHKFQIKQRGCQLVYSSNGKEKEINDDFTLTFEGKKLEIVRSGLKMALMVDNEEFQATKIDYGFPVHPLCIEDFMYRWQFLVTLAITNFDLGGAIISTDDFDLDRCLTRFLQLHKLARRGEYYGARLQQVKQLLVIEATRNVLVGTLQMGTKLNIAGSEV
jgi:hypothetical protein